MSEIKEQIVEQATHLLDWLPGAYDHCKYGSREWCDGYLSNAVEVIQSQQRRIEALETALRPFAAFDDGIGHFTGPSRPGCYAYESSLVGYRELLECDFHRARRALNATPQDGKGGEE